MIFDDESDSENMQRFKNLLLFRMPLTNKERDDALPWIMLGVILVVVIALIAKCAA